MKQSLRAKRKARHHKRLSGAGKLNLVSLMDIFTILVFFLMFNQSEVRVLQNTKELKLPVSVAEQLPHENIVITVLQNSVLVQERLIWQATNSNTSLSSALKQELAYQASKRPSLTEQEKLQGRGVTILGDASVEYDLLKEIMSVCAETDYRNMSLAVEQIASTNQTSSGGA